MGLRRTNWRKGVKYMVTKGRGLLVLSRQLTIRISNYDDVHLKIMLLTNVTSKY